MGITQVERSKAPFSINKLVKFDCTPARWSVTVGLDNHDLTVNVDSETFYTFSNFQSAFHEQTDVMLKRMSQIRWREMIGKASVEVKRPPK